MVIGAMLHSEIGNRDGGKLRFVGSAGSDATGWCIECDGGFWLLLYVVDGLGMQPSVRRRLHALAVGVLRRHRPVIGCKSV